MNPISYIILLNYLHVIVCKYSILDNIILYFCSNSINNSAYIKTVYLHLEIITVRNIYDNNNQTYIPGNFIYWRSDASCSNSVHRIWVYKTHPWIVEYDLAFWLRFEIDIVVIFVSLLQPWWIFFSHLIGNRL